MTRSASRYTLRDLPLSAKLVLTAFLISVGIGYLWAMAQIHFKHSSPGQHMPTVEDLVARFSGVPWPLEPKPEPAAGGAKNPDEQPIGEVNGDQPRVVKIKSILDSRCARCHKPGADQADKPLTNFEEIKKFLSPIRADPKGRMHRMLTDRREEWESKSMAQAFFEKSADWPEDSESQKAEEPKREAERVAVMAWLEAGAPQAQYEANAFPLPAGKAFNSMARKWIASVAGNGGAAHAAPGPDKWKEAKSRQMSVTGLTQSTHAHLLTFSLLWAATGLIFAFTSYPGILRGTLAPLVLVAQVADVACWWLARLEPPAGPYFAIAILGTGLVVGLGLTLQIVLSLWNMYGAKGKAVLVFLFLAGAFAFGVTYVKVIEPQLEDERKLVANHGK
jgi:hypothetical protein